MSHTEMMWQARHILGVHWILVLSLAAACGGDDDKGGKKGSGDGDGGDGDIDPGNLGDGDGDGDSGNGVPGPYMLPEGFTPGNKGGYKLGEEITDEAVVPDIPDMSGDGCGSVIVGLVRDFKRGDRNGGHPDFETYTGSGEKGIVEVELGSDKKPVHASGDKQFTTSVEDFNQWYRNIDGVNRTYLAYFSFEPNAGVLTFQSNAFFPLDGAGFGNEDHDHNFGFTTEIHTEFRYNGGETFSFTGDDDLWVFINNRLAIDLGGLHSELSDSVSLDDAAEELGIERGSTYPLDLFHAERHTNQSNFRVDTNLQFTNCNIVLDTPIR
jgi:fibro-slime domain-containing protein